MDCRDSALFSGVDEASCENMLRCFSAYEQRFTSGQTILTCGQQQDMIGVLLSGSAALLRLHPDGNSTVLESLEEGSVFLSGHTHIPVLKADGRGILRLNPGSVSIPKENSPHGYMTLENGKFLWKDLDGREYMRYDAKKTD